MSSSFGSIDAAAQAGAAGKYWNGSQGILQSTAAITTTPAGRDIWKESGWGAGNGVHSQCGSLGNSFGSFGGLTVPTSPFGIGNSSSSINTATNNPTTTGSASVKSGASLNSSLTSLNFADGSTPAFQFGMGRRDNNDATRYGFGGGGVNYESMSSATATKGSEINNDNSSMSSPTLSTYDNHRTNFAAIANSINANNINSDLFGPVKGESFGDIGTLGQNAFLFFEPPFQQRKVPQRPPLIQQQQQPHLQGMTAGPGIGPLPAAVTAMQVPQKGYFTCGTQFESASASASSYNTCSSASSISSSSSSLYRGSNSGFRGNTGIFENAAWHGTMQTNSNASPFGKHNDRGNDESMNSRNNNNNNNNNFEGDFVYDTFLFNDDDEDGNDDDVLLLGGAGRGSETRDDNDNESIRDQLLMGIDGNGSNARGLYGTTNSFWNAEPFFGSTTATTATTTANTSANTASTNTVDDNNNIWTH